MPVSFTTQSIKLEASEVFDDSVYIRRHEHLAIVPRHDVGRTWTRGAALRDHRVRAHDRFINVIRPALTGDHGQVRANLPAG